MISKWGTFVEWIFDTISYLPYLNNDFQSRFYQWFLFDSCLDYSLDDAWEVTYTDNLCHVTTRDYKTYYASINSWNVWSDWVPFSIEDIYFTYHDIIKENKLEIDYLEKYANIDVSLEADQVKVVFKNSSQDNTLFFTNYILPKHALLEPNKDMYSQSFAIEPVHDGCAKIKSQTTDQDSLIFDLSNCNDTSLWYYQIKMLKSLSSFKESLSQMNWSIIDVYEGEDEFDWYNTINLRTNKLVALFFNTKSDKMTVRLRRALWWFIYYNFFDTDDNEYIMKYDWDVFTQYLSSWWNVLDFLSRVNVNKWLTKDELVESGVRPYTWKVSFTQKDKVVTFYSEDSSSSYSFDMSFDTEYNKIWIQINNKTWSLFYPSNYNSKTKSAKFVASQKDGSLVDWLNNYIIYSISWEKKDQIWTINLYNLDAQQLDETEAEQLVVLYFDDKVSNYIVSRLKVIFSEFWIAWNFKFMKFDDVNEMEWKLTAWDYDIVINTIDMWLNKDISALFGSETSKTNPSQYSDARLLSLLKQYNESDNKVKIVSEINSIYANDMPLVMLWREYDQVHMKDELYNKLDIDNLYFYEYNWRDLVYKYLSLTENIYVDKDEVKNLKNFWKFIKDPNTY